MLLHLGPNVITFRSLLHLGKLLHLGLQQLSHINVQALMARKKQAYASLCDDQVNTVC